MYIVLFPWSVLVIKVEQSSALAIVGFIDWSVFEMTT